MHDHEPPPPAPSRSSEPFTPPKSSAPPASMGPRPSGIGLPLGAPQPGQQSRVRVIIFAVVGALAVCAVLLAVVALLTPDDDDAAADPAGNSTSIAAAAAPTSPPSTPASTADAAQDASTATLQSSGAGPGSGPGGTGTESAQTSDVAAPTEPPAAPASPTASPTSPPPPMATATATVPATPTPEVMGSGRTQPLPLGQSGVTPNGDWDVQVLEVHRGSDAWDRILAANQFNRPPAPGMEYVLAQVRVKYLGTSADAQSVGVGWFTTTGDARVRWSWVSVVEPEPMLETDLFSGGEMVGWTAVQVRQDETNLVLIFEPLISSVEGDELFLGLQDGAAVAPVTARLAEPNALGFDRQEPVALGERVVGDVWELWVIESVRGDAALQLLKDANQFNDDPAPGMEYVLVHVGARNVSIEAGTQMMEQFAFTMTGDQNRVYDLPSLVEPEPSLSYDVYAGGEVSGWVALECAAGETTLRLIYEPLFSFTGEPRFFALE